MHLMVNEILNTTYKCMHSWEAVAVTHSQCSGAAPELRVPDGMSARFASRGPQPRGLPANEAGYILEVQT